MLPGSVNLAGTIVFGEISLLTIISLIALIAVAPHVFRDLLALARRKVARSDRDDAINWAMDMLNREDWVIIDTETTGLNEDAQIIEIAIISHTGSPLLNERMQPKGITRMPKKAQDVHGISFKELKEKPTFSEILPKISAAIGSKTVIAYNAEYDARLLKQSAHANGCRIELPKFACAMQQYAKFIGQWDDYRKQYKLQQLPNAQHGALADCIATLDLIRLMASKKIKLRIT